MLFPHGLEMFIECQVTHPPGTLLDEFGNPILDENNQPMRMDQLRQEDRR
jgi:hypothetical protein